MKKITKGFILPSTAFTVRGSQIKFYEFYAKRLAVDYVLYGRRAD